MFLKIGQKLTILCPKRILNRGFALAGEIIHDKNFSFMQYFSLELKDFILSKYL